MHTDNGDGLSHQSCKGAQTLDNGRVLNLDLQPATALTIRGRIRHSSHQGPHHIKALDNAGETLLEEIEEAHAS